MRVLVCGGRKYDDDMHVFHVLSTLHTGPRGPIKVIIHGAARGADAIGREWAREYNIPHRPFKAAWNDIWRPGAVIKHALSTGKGYDALAGFVRNQRMIDEGKPDICVPFFTPGAKNAGTQDMVDRCIKAGIEVLPT